MSCSHTPLLLFHHPGMGNDKNECEALAGGRQWSSGLSENPTVQLGTYGPIRQICDVTYGPLRVV